MWTRTHSIITKDATAQQLWKLFSNVNQWHTWDTGIEYAKMEGAFVKGNRFILKPKGGPKVSIELVETTPDKSFTDFTRFPLAKMYGTHLFEETAEGLKVTTTMKVEGLLSFLWIKLVAQGIVDSLPVEMEAQVKHAGKL
ncbi:MAG: SRPBCC family protein [Bacteroidetes bacterium]|nr:SRPBCC family protein [Bacteroidota bacterium]